MNPYCSNLQFAKPVVIDSTSKLWTVSLTQALKKFQIFKYLDIWIFGLQIFWIFLLCYNLPVVFFRSLATKLLKNLGVLGLEAFFRLVTYPLPKHTKTKQKGPEKYKNAQIIPACIVRFLTFDIWHMIFVCIV